MAQKTNPKARILTLAKVMIALAWTDGEITHEEKECLKDLLFRIPNEGLEAGIQLTAQEWAMLDIYMDSPVGDAERARLVADLQDAIRNSEDRQIVIAYLTEIVKADGDISPEEQKALDAIENAVDASGTGFMDSLRSLFGGSMARRSAAVANAPNREEYFNEFLNNKVYFELKQQLAVKGKTLDIPDEELRRMGLAGGLMTRIIKVDQAVTEAEIDTMVDAIQRYWEIDRDTAVFIARVALSSLDQTYDYYRMTRQFGEMTSREERLGFLNVLFQVAAADGKATINEIEEIRLIARGINLSHQDFIAAKLTLPRDRREE
ncbi:MAG TPA: hypothetical protein EYP41_04975 [Anaerolineae bacterium]|nr:hypothetical protein [Anaerolineae bacterium]HIP71424.1 hypothetical protein [Anaerolineae bacterium]